MSFPASRYGEGVRASSRACSVINDSALTHKPLPLRAIRLRSGGRCGCTACVNDDLAAEALRDVAVVQSVISPARAAQGEGAGRVEVPARVITRASAFSTNKFAEPASAPQKLGTGAVQLRVGVVAAPVPSTLLRKAR